ncbi:MAG: hypothetical protein CL557_12835 [Alphaproteobacteria bacterium]|nr:hypothetical protein [Alphaproteobacteria bacterium]
MMMAGAALLALGVRLAIRLFIVLTALGIVTLLLKDMEAHTAEALAGVMVVTQVMRTKKAQGAALELFGLVI